jgi:branched-chain amino acid transport system substrate-binding protein
MARIALVLAALFVTALGVSACGDDDDEASGSGSDSQAKSTEPFVLGLPIARTGFLTVTDGPASAGVELAVEDLNKEGGIDGRQIELVYSDNRSKIEEGARAAEEVIADGAEVIVASCDYDFGAPAARVAGQNKMIAISLCAGSPLFGIEGIGPYAFSMGTPTDPTVGAVMAAFTRQQGWERPYLLKDLSIDYSKSVCDAFQRDWEDAGGEIAGSDTFQNDDPTITSQVRGIGSSDADSVVLCTYPPGGASAVKQIRSAGIDLPIVSDDGMDGAYWLEATPNLSDFYYPAAASVFGDDPNEAVNTAVKDYETKQGEPPPSAFALLGYGLVESVKAAYEKAGSTDGDAMKEALESFDEQPVIFGVQSFSPEAHQDVNRPMKFMEVQNGQHKYLETIAPESAE